MKTSSLMIVSTIFNLKLVSIRVRGKRSLTRTNYILLKKGNQKLQILKMKHLF